MGWSGFLVVDGCDHPLYQSADGFRDRGVRVYGERIDWQQGLAYGIIVVSIVLFNWRNPALADKEGRGCRIPSLGLFGPIIFGFMPTYSLRRMVSGINFRVGFGCWTGSGYRSLRGASMDFWVLTGPERRRRFGWCLGCCGGSRGRSGFLGGRWRRTGWGCCDGWGC